MVSIFVTYDTVSSEIVSFVRFQVYTQISRMITETGTCHPRPRLLDGKHSFNGAVFVRFGKFFSRPGVQNHRFDSKERPSTGSRNHRSDAWNISDDVSSCFCLPVGVDDGAFGSTNNFVIPTPCFRVDWLAH